MERTIDVSITRATSPPDYGTPRDGFSEWEVRIDGYRHEGRCAVRADAVREVLRLIERSIERD